ncbi:hypothetical protein [Helicobacter sp. 16-1353]|uniref:hypothetical protein n=1 Tax=Helicobacter sp. 16-1353 TaxID=2004996 RepID=UPI00215D4C76|nr:hypothetical protein [Helicobacter sp. 16-1353]
MKILFSDNFLTQLENILDFIAKDSPKRAIEFNSSLFQAIENIYPMPLENSAKIES